MIKDYDRFVVLLLSILFVFITLGVSLLAFIAYVFYIANSNNLVTDKINTIIVLGKRLTKNTPDNDYEVRLIRAKKALEFNSKNIIYILGGNTSSSNITESKAGKKYLLTYGVNTDKVIIEERSKHTLENLKNFYKMLTDKSQKILLITNRYHMARSLIMAKGFGIKAFPYPAEDRLDYTLRNIAKIAIESFYLNFYFVKLITHFLLLFPPAKT